MKHISIRVRLIAMFVIFITVFTCFSLFTIVRIRELEHVNKSIYEDWLLQGISREDKQLSGKFSQSVNAEAAQLINQANGIKGDLEKLLVLINIGLIAFLSIFFGLVIRSIMKSIHMLQHTMNESAVTGMLMDATLEGNKEISDIAKSYNTLIQNLRNQFWLKDGQNSLNQEIAASSSLRDMTQRSLNFLA
ncbi:MAG: hypothetical protein K0S75_1853, partial [Clostridia bacterium]|nr:hypothetical protein [Clostridia bacterium]